MNMLVHEEQYRGQKLIKKIANQKVTICGAGAIGSNLVENMVRQGFRNITVIDFDRVEDHNRHTQTYNWRDVGQLKVNALRSSIYNMMGVSIKVISRKLLENNVKKLLLNDQLIIDGFDNTESRSLVTKYCSDHNIECLHAGLYKDYAEVVWNHFYRVPQPVKGLDVCEYPLARNIVMIAVIVATEVIIRYIDSQDYENYAITLGDMKISRYQ